MRCVTPRFRRIRGMHNIEKGSGVGYSICRHTAGFPRTCFCSVPKGRHYVSPGCSDERDNGRRATLGNELDRNHSPERGGPMTALGRQNTTIRGVDYVVGSRTCFTEPSTRRGRTNRPGARATPCGVPAGMTFTSQGYATFADSRRSTLG